MGHVSQIDLGRRSNASGQLRLLSVIDGGLFSTQGTEEDHGQ